jgi:hypothetical protein
MQGVTNMSGRLPCLALIGALVLSGCGGSDSPPTTGTLDLTVVESGTTTGLADARVIVIDGDTGDSLGLLTTDADGKASGTYEAGAIQLRVSKQDYSSSPPAGIPPLPVQIIADQSTAITVSLKTLATGDRGWISGQVTTDQGQAAAGALVVVTAGDGSVLSTTAYLDGTFVAYNVPAGAVSITAFLGGQNFETHTAVNVTADTNTVQDIASTGAAYGEIYGHVSFTAISGDIIDITLLYPGTRDKLPGLRVETDSGASYAMTGVPYGDFEIIASLENDGFVLDPDTSVTQGIPTVSITTSAPVITSMDFKVTGSIQLTNPPQVVDAQIPELGGTPTFTWAKASSYASADYYVVEVVDESGETVWGGFDTAANNFAPLVLVPQGNNPSAVYDFDGSAVLSTLESGRYYQVRVYAAVIDTSETKGYRLLSASETLDGLFRVAPSQ